jgi:hypothetical protein
MAFSLPFYVKSSKLFVKCVVNNATNSTDWMYQMPDQTFVSKFPECNYLCDKDPLVDPNSNRTWITGTLTVDTEAKYVCPGNFKIIKLISFISFYESFKKCFITMQLYFLRVKL